MTARGAAPGGPTPSIAGDRSASHPVGQASGGLSWVALLVAVASVLAFSPILGNEFVHWDDQATVMENRSYHGLGWQQLRWMATAVVLGHWMPLTWLSYAADHAVWGLDPAGYHLTSLLLHGANAALVTLIAARLLRVAPGLAGGPLLVGGGMAGLFFAIHPLRVEPVVWVSERRGLLAGLFALLAIHGYLRAQAASGRQRRWRLAGSVGAYALALASKSSVMTLPLVLVLLDLYPLRRLPPSVAAWWQRPVRPVWAEKAPYLALATAGAGIAYWAHWLGVPNPPYPWPGRVAVVLNGLWLHLAKTAVPATLGPFYELPAQVSPFHPAVLPGALAGAAITVALIVLRRRWPAGLAAWAYQAICLLPVSGIVYNVVLGADRYTYLAGLGWALLAGAGAGLVARAARQGVVRQPVGWLAAGAALTWLAGASALAWRQIDVWHDTGQLWRHAVTVAPDCAVCHGNLGVWLTTQGEMHEALGHFQQALALRPDQAVNHLNLARVLEGLGGWSGAAEHYQRFLELAPRVTGVSSRLGLALVRAGRAGEAVPHLRRALEQAPDSAAGLTNLGMALTAAGEPREAVTHLERALALRPDDAPARLWLVRAHLALGESARARARHRELQALDPAMADGLAAELPSG